MVYFSSEETDATDMTSERARDATREHGVTGTPESELTDLDVWTDTGVGHAHHQFRRGRDVRRRREGHHGSGAVERAMLASTAETVVRSETVR